MNFVIKRDMDKGYYWVLQNAEQRIIAKSDTFYRGPGLCKKSIKVLLSALRTKLVTYEAPGVEGRVGL